MHAGRSHAATTMKESDIKAAIIFNLARFSEWPESSHHNEGDSFSICSHASKTMEAALDSLSGKVLHGRSLNVIHIYNIEDVSHDCEVLFISNIPENLDLDHLHGQGILTMSDQSTFTQNGGAMSIQRHGKKIRFTINSSAMNDANIRPSSKILSLSVEPPQ